jgi:hypothetical protein
MMKIFRPLLFVSFIAPAQANESCIPRDEFISSVAHLKPDIYKGNDKVAEAFTVVISNSKNKKLVVDEVLVGTFSSSGMTYVGIVMLKDGCVIKGSTGTMPASQWVIYLIGLGLTADDFTKLKDA